jgi:hypothetical protein
MWIDDISFGRSCGCDGVAKKETIDDGGTVMRPNQSMTTLIRMEFSSVKEKKLS